MSNYQIRFNQYGVVEENIENVNQNFDDLARITQLIGVLK